MTALPSVRMVTALADLESLRQEPVKPPMDDPRYIRIRDTLIYMLHCLNGSSHEGEAN